MIFIKYLLTSHKVNVKIFHKVDGTKSEELSRGTHLTCDLYLCLVVLVVDPTGFFQANGRQAGPALPIKRLK